MPQVSTRSLFAFTFVLLSGGCSNAPRAPDTVQPGGYRFELYTRATPEADSTRAVTGVFYLAAEPFADSARLLQQREQLADIAPLSRLERHVLATGKSNFCFAASPETTSRNGSLAIYVPVAFSVAGGDPRMVEVLMYHNVDWAYSWRLMPDGRGGVRGEGRGEERMWELYEDTIRVMPDDAVSVESCIDFARRDRERIERARREYRRDDA